MQYVNDDMDELFRRAAENYPLDTSSANWSKVLALMEGETEDKTVSEKKQNNNRRLLWLLLLLPLSFVCNQLYTPGFLNGDGAQKVSGTEAKSAETKNIPGGVTMDSKVSTVKENTTGSLSIKEGTALPTKQNGAINKALVVVGVQKDKATYGASVTPSRRSIKTSNSYIVGQESFNQSTDKTKETDVDVSRDAALYNRTFVYSVASSPPITPV